MNKVWIGVLPDFFEPIKTVYDIEVARLPEIGDKISVWYPMQGAFYIEKVPVIGRVTGIYGYEADGKIIFEVETKAKTITNVSEKYLNDLHILGYRRFQGSTAEEHGCGKIDD